MPIPALLASSTPPGHLAPYPFYFTAILALLPASKAPPDISPCD